MCLPTLISSKGIPAFYLSYLLPRRYPDPSYFTVLRTRDLGEHLRLRTTSLRLPDPLTWVGFGHWDWRRAGERREGMSPSSFPPRGHASEVATGAPRAVLAIWSLPCMSPRRGSININTVCFPHHVRLRVVNASHHPGPQHPCWLL